MHYRPMLTFDNESPKGNALVFATEAEALAAAKDTFHNLTALFKYDWMNPRISGYTTEATDDPVNCKLQSALFAQADGNHIGEGGAVVSEPHYFATAEEAAQAMSDYHQGDVVDSDGKYWRR